jgi:hypothetical protein
MDWRRARMIVSMAPTLAVSLVPSVAMGQSSASDDAAAAAGLSLFTLFSSFMCIFYAAGIVLVVGFMALWLIVLIDLLQRSDAEFPSAMAGHPNPNDKIVWLLVVFLTGGVGALIYYIAVMRKAPRGRGAAPTGGPSV